MGARPGRWGILMPSQTGGPGSVKPIIGPDGEFVDPSANASAIFDQLRREDWWNPEVKRERERAQAEAKRAAEKRKQQERDEMTEDILEAYLAKTRAFVSMNSDQPWTGRTRPARALPRQANTYIDRSRRQPTIRAPWRSMTRRSCRRRRSSRQEP
jgi:hypothetical protein